MDLRKFWSSYRGILQENFFYRVLCVLLLGTNLLLGVVLLTHKEVVVLVPPSLKSQVKVSLKRGDEKYQETWALFFGLLLGNITPQNVDFVTTEIEKYLAPFIYQDVLKDVFEQAKGIKASNISTSFEPRELVYDDKSNHVLVKGEMTMRGPFGKPQNLSKTFEFGITVKNYYPEISFLDAYDMKRKEEPANVKRKPTAPAATSPGH